MEIFSLQIQTIKEMLDWRVTLDIFLITFLIYFLYRTLRTTGTGKIVIGIMIAGIVFIAARLLNLRGIDWIYSNLSQILLFALIVIFQPELRKFFERAASIRRKETRSEGPKLSSIVSDAIFAMASRRIGAIFVFPGQDSVTAWTSKGIQLEAYLSYPLLMSIFDPHSPGHDGAVVIENGKVTSFSVRLPLSDSNKLTEDYGTRHHAGLGLTEVTDALVVVVSEERGTVMLFYEGFFERVDDKNDLSARILKFWSIVASYQLFNQKKVPLKKIVREIVISFILAFLFWSTVVLTKSELKEMIYTVPIEYISMPKNYQIVGEKPAEIMINLLGRAADLGRINPTQLRAVIDLSKITTGKKNIKIDENNLELPGQVRVVKTKPLMIHLNIIEMREVEAKIAAQFVGSLPDGFKMDSLEIHPKTITVLAPVDSLRKVAINLLTTPIYLEHVKQNTKIVCNLVAPANIQPIKGRFPDVQVYLAVKDTTQTTTEESFQSDDRVNN